MVFEQILYVFLALYFKATTDEPLQLDFLNCSGNRSINIACSLVGLWLENHKHGNGVNT
jgi:hypothetical protein